MAFDSYKMPFQFGEAEFIEKKSKFISRVWPVEQEAKALEHLALIREKHWDATHNVFAYSIRNGQTRYSDDGEPQGTSGLPTLDVFRKEGITNVCCITTRYFGGVLLGAGGLVRAYSKSAKLALEAAGICLMQQWEQAILSCPYNFYEILRKIILDFNGVIENSEFAVDVTLEVLIPIEEYPVFVLAVQNASAGSLEPVRMDTLFRGVKIA